MMRTVAHIMEAMKLYHKAIGFSSFGLIIEGLFWSKISRACFHWCVMVENSPSASNIRRLARRFFRTEILQLSRTGWMKRRVDRYLGAMGESRRPVYFLLLLIYGTLEFLPRTWLLDWLGTFHSATSNHQTPLEAKTMLATSSDTPFLIAWITKMLRLNISYLWSDELSQTNKGYVLKIILNKQVQQFDRWYHWFAIDFKTS